MKRMKKFPMAMLLLAGIATVSCGSKNEQNEDTDQMDTVPLEVVEEVETVDVVEAVEPDEAVSSSDESTSASTSSSSNDWDSFLDSYERYATKYIAFCKKVGSGEISVTDPEYQEMMQEAANFAKQTGDASPSTMTASQWARYNKINAKITAAASDL